MKPNQEVNQERWVGIGFFTIIALIVILTLAQSASSAEPPVKVTDDFSQLDADKWSVRVPHQGRVGVQDGELVMINRGYVFARREIVKKVTATFEWSWKDHTKNDSEKSQYADHFLVLLRTTGKVCKKRAYETEDGLRIRVITGNGTVRLESAKPDNEGEILHEVRLPKEGGKPALAPDMFHTMTVSDDGVEITVTLNDKEIMKQKYKGEFKGRLVGFANRENVAFPHEVRVKNVTLEFTDK